MKGSLLGLVLLLLLDLGGVVDGGGGVDEVPDGVGPRRGGAEQVDDVGIQSAAAPSRALLALTRCATEYSSSSSSSDDSRENTSEPKVSSSSHQYS